jgi:hypothetical protein
MIGKRAVLSASALAMALVATFPGVAFAGSRDNNNASIEGISASDPIACPSGYFCVYTGRNYTGRMYKLYYCRTYNLYNWNGRGSYQNNNNPPVAALLQDENYHTIHLVEAKSTPRGTRPFPIVWSNPDYDFVPVWHIKPC